MKRQKLINVRRERRRNRVRNAVRGTVARPRLTVARSHKAIACQVIDDSTGITLVSASSRETALREQIGYGGNRAAAEKIGKVIAERAVAKGIKAVCFDRGHFRYHGRVAALANAAREAGLSF
jgi:large subunit ribosomal protein L18